MTRHNNVHHFFQEQHASLSFEVSFTDRRTVILEKMAEAIEARVRVKHVLAEMRKMEHIIAWIFSHAKDLFKGTISSVRATKTIK